MHILLTHPWYNCQLIFLCAVSGVSGPGLVRNVTSFAAIGEASNPNNNILFRNNTGISTGKSVAFGFQCNNSFNRTSIVTCGNSDRPAPACCNTQAATANCYTWDNGSSVKCTEPDSPFPACCEYRCLVTPISSPSCPFYLHRSWSRSSQNLAGLQLPVFEYLLSASAQSQLSILIFAA